MDSGVGSPPISPDAWRVHDFAEALAPPGMNLWLPGQYHDTETGLYNNWHRYYNLEMGGAR
ncbi:MAG: hypothetical protein D6795_05660 [Deltaproteobacteria bacterium]|nr:MAG: hypothetical protein D6795_05660 [Deltaproteobacteria bacterium]